MQRHDMKDLSADELATNLERERAELAQNIDGLRDRLSVDALMGDAFGYAKANMAPYARALDGAVRAHPIAAVMAGVGLAWLVFGRRTSSSPPEVPLAGTKFEALARWEDEGGPVAPLPDADGAWMADTDALRNTASGVLAQIDEAARQRLRTAADVALDRAQVLADLAKSTRMAMMQGLDNLTTEARDRILMIREQAYAARIATVRQGTKLIEEQPIMVGAIGMAIGAVVAAALPRTPTEDRMFGQDRDRLISRAQEALHHDQRQGANKDGRRANSSDADVNANASPRLS